ncbi:hypothetical protein BESB_027900 [Besnoitia besnoiti]|uniref:Uncharacterized protein n=1 Tax=Besnoitia besnoiti TaxID=94643 RepID=A0A2A9M053_BESBE|nr:uncharacterized protein BESB_027900 [Besnoitia besnoiti]PFH31355.1 hypothetical protein BESB_027900 [Besnoitia besnoiti]
MGFSGRDSEVEPAQRLQPQTGGAAPLSSLLDGGGPPVSSLLVATGAAAPLHGPASADCSSFLRSGVQPTRLALAPACARRWIPGDGEALNLLSEVSPGFLRRSQPPGPQLPCGGHWGAVVGPLAPGGLRPETPTQRQRTPSPPLRMSASPPQTEGSTAGYASPPHLLSRLSSFENANPFPRQAGARFLFQPPHAALAGARADEQIYGRDGLPFAASLSAGYISLGETAPAALRMSRSMPLSGGNKEGRGFCDLRARGNAGHGGGQLLPATSLQGPLRGQRRDDTFFASMSAGDISSPGTDSPLSGSLAYPLPDRGGHALRNPPRSLESGARGGRGPSFSSPPPDLSSLSQASAAAGLQNALGFFQSFGPIKYIFWDLCSCPLLLRCPVASPTACFDKSATTGTRMDTDSAGTTGSRLSRPVSDPCAFSAGLKRTRTPAEVVCMIARFFRTPVSAVKIFYEEEPAKPLSPQTSREGVGAAPPSLVKSASQRGEERVASEQAQARAQESRSPPSAWAEIQPLSRERHSLRRGLPHAEFSSSEKLSPQKQLTPDGTYAREGSGQGSDHETPSQALCDRLDDESRSVLSEMGCLVHECHKRRVMDCVVAELQRALVAARRQSVDEAMLAQQHSASQFGDSDLLASCLSLSAPPTIVIASSIHFDFTEALRTEIEWSRIGEPPRVRLLVCHSYDWPFRPTGFLSQFIKKMEVPPQIQSAVYTATYRQLVSAMYGVPISLLHPFSPLPSPPANCGDCCLIEPWTGGSEEAFEVPRRHVPPSSFLAQFSAPCPCPVATPGPAEPACGAVDTRSLLSPFQPNVMLHRNRNTSLFSASRGERKAIPVSLATLLPMAEEGSSFGAAAAATWGLSNEVASAAANEDSSRRDAGSAAQNAATVAAACARPGLPADPSRRLVAGSPKGGACDRDAALRGGVLEPDGPARGSNQNYKGERLLSASTAPFGASPTMPERGEHHGKSCDNDAGRLPAPEGAVENRNLRGASDGVSAAAAPAALRATLSSSRSAPVAVPIGGPQRLYASRQLSAEETREDKRLAGRREEPEGNASAGETRSQQTPSRELLELLEAVFASPAASPAQDAEEPEYRFHKRLSMTDSRHREPGLSPRSSSPELPDGERRLSANPPVSASLPGATKALKGSARISGEAALPLAPAPASCAAAHAFADLSSELPVTLNETAQGRAAWPDEEILLPGHANAPVARSAPQHRAEVAHVPTLLERGMEEKDSGDTLDDLPHEDCPLPGAGYRDTQEIPPHQVLAAERKTQSRGVDTSAAKPATRPVPRRPDPAMSPRGEAAEGGRGSSGGCARLSGLPLPSPPAYQAFSPFSFSVQLSAERELREAPRRREPEYFQFDNSGEESASQPSSSDFGLADWQLRELRPLKKPLCRELLSNTILLSPIHSAASSADMRSSQSATARPALESEHEQRTQALISEAPPAVPSSRGPPQTNQETLERAARERASHQWQTARATWPDRRPAEAPEGDTDRGRGGAGAFADASGRARPAAGTADGGSAREGRVVDAREDRKDMWPFESEARAQVEAFETRTYVHLEGAERRDAAGGPGEGRRGSTQQATQAGVATYAHGSASLAEGGMRSPNLSSSVLPPHDHDAQVLCGCRQQLHYVGYSPQTAGDPHECSPPLSSAASGAPSWPFSSAPETAADPSAAQVGAAGRDAGSEDGVSTSAARACAAPEGAAPAASLTAAELQVTSEQASLVSASSLRVVSSAASASSSVASASPSFAFSPFSRSLSLTLLPQANPPLDAPSRRGTSTQSHLSPSDVKRRVSRFRGADDESEPPHGQGSAAVSSSGPVAFERKTTDTELLVTASTSPAQNMPREFSSSPLPPSAPPPPAGTSSLPYPTVRAAAAAFTAAATSGSSGPSRPAAVPPLRLPVEDEGRAHVLALGKLQSRGALPPQPQSVAPDHPASHAFFQQYVLEHAAASEQQERGDESAARAGGGEAAAQGTAPMRPEDADALATLASTSSASPTSAVSFASSFLFLAAGDKPRGPRAAAPRARKGEAWEREDAATRAECRPRRVLRRLKTTTDEAKRGGGFLGGVCCETRFTSLPRCRVSKQMSEAANERRGSLSLNSGERGSGSRLTGSSVADSSCASRQASTFLAEGRRESELGADDAPTSGVRQVLSGLWNAFTSPTPNPEAVPPVIPSSSMSALSSTYFSSSSPSCMRPSSCEHPAWDAAADSGKPGGAESEPASEGAHKAGKQRMASDASKEKQGGTTEGERNRDRDSGWSRTTKSPYMSAARKQRKIRHRRT